jgi:hypothetical protein
LSRATIGSRVKLIWCAASCAATVKGQRVYLTNRQAGIAAIMEFTRQKDRDLSARVYDDHMKTIARDGTISEKLQRIVIERSKRFTGRDA